MGDEIKAVGQNSRGTVFACAPNATCKASEIRLFDINNKDVGFSTVILGENSTLIADEGTVDPSFWLQKADINSKNYTLKVVPCGGDFNTPKGCGKIVSNDGKTKIVSGSVFGMTTVETKEK